MTLDDEGLALLREAHKTIVQACEWEGLMAEEEVELLDAIDAYLAKPRARQMTEADADEERRSDRPIDDFDVIFIEQMRDDYCDLEDPPEYSDLRDTFRGTAERLIDALRQLQKAETELAEARNLLREADGL